MIKIFLKFFLLGLDDILLCSIPFAIGSVAYNCFSQMWISTGISCITWFFLSTLLFIIDLFVICMIGGILEVSIITLKDTFR